jgi:hypothetical protein
MSSLWELSAQEVNNKQLNPFKIYSNVVDMSFSK